MREAGAGRAHRSGGGKGGRGALRASCVVLLEGKEGLFTLWVGRDGAGSHRWHHASRCRVGARGSGGKKGQAQGTGE